MTLVTTSYAAYGQHTTATPASTVSRHTVNNCTGITAKTVVVSTGKRRLWACQLGRPVYTSSVVTGYDKNLSNITPAGTYRILAKHSDYMLRGADSLGSWDEHVDYWLPFLHNQYGNYGFHDADWRAPAAFGNINPDSPQASHGCVELPTSTAAWLYKWATVGTAVRIAT